MFTDVVTCPVADERGVTGLGSFQLDVFIIVKIEVAYFCCAEFCLDCSSLLLGWAGVVLVLNLNMDVFLHLSTLDSDGIATGEIVLHWIVRIVGRVSLLAMS